jgi:hypothetical protein
MTAKKSPSVKTKTTTKKAAAKKAGATTSPSRAPAEKATAKKTRAKKTRAKSTAAKKTSATKTAARTTAPKASAKTAKTANTAKTAKSAKPAKPRPAAKARGASPAVPPARPSDRAMAVVAQLPSERALTDEEREAMSKCALTALATLEVDGVPEVIVMRIAAFIDDVRGGRRPEPNSQDIRLGLGVLWGEQVRAQVGWRWVHLSYPNGFASYALVPDDRAFACFPLNRLTDLMRLGADGMNTSVPLFDSIRVGALPARRENAYLVIG